jgi:hypothetical protein
MTTYIFGSAPSGPRSAWPADPPDNPAIIRTRAAMHQATRRYNGQRTAARNANHAAEAIETKLRAKYGDGWYTADPAGRNAYTAARDAMHALYAPLAQLETDETAAATAYEETRENAIYHNARNAGRTHDEAQRTVNNWKSRLSQ